MYLPFEVNPTMEYVSCSSRMSLKTGITSCGVLGASLCVRRDQQFMHRYSLVIAVSRTISKIIDQNMRSIKISLKFQQIKLILYE